MHAPFDFNAYFHSFIYQDGTPSTPVLFTVGHDGESDEEKKDHGVRNTSTAALLFVLFSLLVSLRLYDLMFSETTRGFHQ